MFAATSPAAVVVAPVLVTLNDQIGLSVCDQITPAGIGAAATPFNSKFKSSDELLVSTRLINGWYLRDAGNVDSITTYSLAPAPIAPNVCR